MFNPQEEIKDPFDTDEFRDFFRNFLKEESDKYMSLFRDTYNLPDPGLIPGDGILENGTKVKISRINK